MCSPTRRASAILMARLPVVSYCCKPTLQPICLKAAKLNYVAASPISLPINQEREGASRHSIKRNQPMDNIVITKQELLVKPHDCNRKSNQFLDLNKTRLQRSQDYKFPQVHLKNKSQIFTTSRSFSSQSTPQPTIKKSSPEEPTTMDKKLTKAEQLKRAFKEYGTTIMAFHVAISMISLGSFYALVSGGIDLVPVLEFLGFSSSALAEQVANGSTFVVAFAIHKILAPIRISITLGAAPFIVRYLRSKGLLKVKAT